MTKRILISQKYGIARSYHALSGEMESVIRNMMTMLNDAKSAGYSNIKISWNEGYSSDDIEWCIFGDRLETDQEYNKRIAAEKRLAKSKKDEKLLEEQKERKEYERLKKKFEDKI